MRKSILVFGLIFVAAGFLFSNWSGRRVHIDCVRLESQFLPNCEVRETFLDILPTSRVQKIDEARGLIQYGRRKPEFMIKQGRGAKSLVGLKDNSPETLARVPGISDLRQFFEDGGTNEVRVTIADPSGNGLYAVICFCLGAILLGWYLVQVTAIPRRPWDA